MLVGTGRLADAARLGGLQAKYFANVLPQVPRSEARLHRGEWLLVQWYAHSDGDRCAPSPASRPRAIASPG
jgi:RNA polymerase sigma-70 factor (ECF subfamily)